MTRANGFRLIRNACLAASLGSSAGAAAALWSAPAPMGRVRTSAIGDAAVDLARATTPRATAGTQAVQASTPLFAGDEGRRILQRAYVLAESADVGTLLELREEINRRAAERGQAELPSTVRVIDQIDRDLANARQLRLKLDAQEFRRISATDSR